MGTFPMILKSFVEVFHNAAPAAMSFTQAMKSSSILLAKEQALNEYKKRMDEVMKEAPSGMDPPVLSRKDTTISEQVKEHFNKTTIFGGENDREKTWTEIASHLSTLRARYEEDNSRLLEKALVGVAQIALLGVVLFVLDKASDWTCDWWSRTCEEASKVLFLAYLGIFGFIGV